MLPAHCTVENFCELARNLILDTGQTWEPHRCQLDPVQDLVDGVKEIWWEAPEGFTKSTTAAAIALWYAYNKPRAKIFLAAASKDQAGEAVYGQAAALVQLSDLESVFEVQDGYRRIRCRHNNSLIKVWSSRKDTGQGLLPDLVIIDEGMELVDWGFVRILLGKLRKKDGQLLLLANAGEPASTYEQVKARNMQKCEVRRGSGWAAGRITASGPGFRLRRWCLPEKADIKNLDEVKKVNPLVPRERLAQDLDSASWDERHWRRMVCGQVISAARRAITSERFDALPRDLIPHGEAIAIGADYAWEVDSTALAPMWFKSMSERLLGPPTILHPPETGPLDPEDVKAAYEWYAERWMIERVVYDPSKDANIALWLRDRFPGIKLVYVDQGDATQARVYDAWMEALRLEQLVVAFSEDPEDADVNAQARQHVLNAIARQARGHDRYRFDRPTQDRNVAQEHVVLIDYLTAASHVHWQLLGDELKDHGGSEFDHLDPADFAISSLG